MRQQAAGQDRSKSMDGDQETLARRGNRGGSEDAHATPLRSQADLVAELKDFIAHNPAIFGGVDIFNIDWSDPFERAGILAAVLTGLVTADHRPVVRAIVIVATPEADLAAAQAAAWGALLTAFQQLAGREMSADAQEWFKARFKVNSAPDLRTRSLLGLISGRVEHAAVIVTDAAKYRDEKVEPYIAPGAATPLLPQDIWVPQVHALATSAVEIARERKLYVAIDTSQLSPTRAALCDVLLSLEGCGVMGSGHDRDLSRILADRVGYWDQWVREGYLGRALREIQDLPRVFDVHKAFLRIQMLHKAGHFNESLRAIREELTSGRKIDASSRVKLSRIAQDANASILAAEVLSPAVDELDSMEDLELALATARNSGNGELEERIASRLAIVFPNSPGIRARKRHMMASVRDYSGIAEMLTDQGDDQAGADFFHELARFLSGAETPDYLGLIASAGADTVRAEAFRIACVQDALRRHLIVHAFELALPLPESPQHSKRGEILLVEVVEAIFLSATKGALPVSDEQIETAVLALVERLAANPTNQRLRVRLAGLVQFSVSGSTGLALMAALVLRLASRPIALAKRELTSVAHADWLLQHKDFLEASFAWLKDQQPVVIGRVVMPGELLTEPADEVLSAVTDYLSHAPVTTEEDVLALQTFLALGASVTPRGTDPDLDLLLNAIGWGQAREFGLRSGGARPGGADGSKQRGIASKATTRMVRCGRHISPLPQLPRRFDCARVRACSRRQCRGGASLARGQRARALLSRLRAV
jgi:hypothetical protein